MTFRTIRKVTDLQMPAIGIKAHHNPDSEFRVRFMQGDAGVCLVAEDLKEVCAWLDAVLQAEDDNAEGAMLNDEDFKVKED